MTKSGLKYLLLLFVLISGCTSDLYTKHLAAQNLKNGRSVSVVDGFLDLKYVENQNGGFGLFHWVSADTRRPLLICMQLLPSLLLCAFIGYFRKKPFLFLLPYLVILSGAVGNLADRIRYGYVVDFLNFHIRDRFYWPVFNVADILLSIGAGLLLLQVLFMKHGPEQAPDETG